MSGGSELRLGLAPEAVSSSPSWTYGPNRPVRSVTGTPFSSWPSSLPSGGPPSSPPGSPPSGRV